MYTVDLLRIPCRSRRQPPIPLGHEGKAADFLRQMAKSTDFLRKKGKTAMSIKRHHGRWLFHSASTDHQIFLRLCRNILVYGGLLCRAHPCREYAPHQQDTSKSCLIFLNILTNSVCCSSGLSSASENPACDLYLCRKKVVAFRATCYGE